MRVSFFYSVISALSRILEKKLKRLRGFGSYREYLLIQLKAARNEEWMVPRIMRDQY